MSGGSDDHFAVERARVVYLERVRTVCRTLVDSGDITVNAYRLIMKALALVDALEEMHPDTVTMCLGVLAPAEGTETEWRRDFP